MTRTATVRVPGSTSNIGSGFDCVGLAVDLWLVATVSLDEIRPGLPSGIAAQREGVSFVRNGTLKGLPVEAANDLVYIGFRSAYLFAGVKLSRHVAFMVSSDIPVGRGLGSSGSAIVAGCMLANEALCLGLTTAQLLALAVDIEGHADNVAAALYGGAVLAVRTAAGHAVARLRVAPGVAFVIVIPGFACDTKVSRSVLPESVAYANAVSAISRSAALVKGLETGDQELLRAGLDDLLHVPYRSAAISGFDEVRAAAIAAGAIGATLSGSGSSLLAIATASVAKYAGDAMVAAWKRIGIDATAIILHEPAGASAIILQENQCP
ncbi:MAG: homoserine kinase [Gemmatimonadaceae bacterium]